MTRYMLLVYIWPLSTVPAHNFQNPWNFLSVKSDTGIFCYVNEVTFGSTEKGLCWSPGELTM